MVNGPLSRRVSTLRVRLTGDLVGYPEAIRLMCGGGGGASGREGSPDHHPPSPREVRRRPKASGRSQPVAGRPSGTRGPPGLGVGPESQHAAKLCLTAFSYISRRYAAGGGLSVVRGKERTSPPRDTAREQQW